MAEKVQAVNMFELSKYNTGDSSCKSKDLKSGNWDVKKRNFDWVKSDITMFRLDFDFIKLAQGKLKPKEVFI